MSDPTDELKIPWWQLKLFLMAKLEPGWDGYQASPPSPAALTTAQHVLLGLEQAQLPPTRVAPSAVGGVGITYKRSGDRSVYVEVYNDRRIQVLFSDGVSEPNSKPVDPRRLPVLAAAMQDFLAG